MYTHTHSHMFAHTGRAQHRCFGLIGVEARRPRSPSGRLRTNVEAIHQQED